jgi:hypothetical protein
VARRTIVAPPLGTKTDRPLSELDVVLDKISQQGIESLTRDERLLLEEMSRELREKD